MTGWHDGGIPVLHVIADDRVLADSRFRDRAAALMDAHGPAMALHLRGHDTPVRTLHAEAAALVPVAREAGTLLLVNDRVDVALAVDAPGVQLGRRSIPVAAARRLRDDWVIGVSVHGPDEAVAAGEAPGPREAGELPDFALLGTIWETRSHPGRPGIGLEPVREAAGRTSLPLIVIGGVTPTRARSARAAGAHGAASLRGIWDADDPVAAAGEYLAAMGDQAAIRDQAREAS